MASSDDVNKRRSSTQMVMIAIPLWSCRTYTQGSEQIHLNPCFFNFVLSSMFHCHPDCLSPYKVLTNKQICPVLSLNPLGCCIYTHSSSVPFKYAPLMSI